METMYGEAEINVLEHFIIEKSTSYEVRSKIMVIFKFSELL